MPYEVMRSKNPMSASFKILNLVRKESITLSQMAGLWFKDPSEPLSYRLYKFQKPHA